MDSSTACQAIVTRNATADTASADKDVDAALRSDFKSMHILATCSICDQLLYEPWTIACGHTYCYSCLCSWFSQDKRKKSCPECRSKVKTMPAPCFLIKQLVEVILLRSDTIADESIEQHQKKRADEIALVDTDRKSPMGLFKGMFSIRQNKLWRDNSDGVFRCAGCGFEHEGGPLCSNCGEQVEQDDEYDEYDDYEPDPEPDDNVTVELGSLGFDIDAESEEEIFNTHNYRHFEQHVSSYIDVAHSRRAAATISQNQFSMNREFDAETTLETDSDDSELSAASDSSELVEDEDDDSSLQDFIAPDDENAEYEASSNRSVDLQQEYQSSRTHQRHAITISDDESDEGGAISNRRQRNRRNNSYFSNIQSPSPVPSVMTITDAGSDDSDVGNHGNTTEQWESARWSPLNNSNDSRKGSGPSSRNGNGYPPSWDEESNTNTETLVDREVSDGEDGEESNESQAENYEFSPSSTYPASNLHHNTHFYGFSESSNSQLTDEDGDTEMNNSHSFSSNTQPGDKFPSASCEGDSFTEKSDSSNPSENEDETVRVRSWLKSPIYVGNGEMFPQAPSDSGTCRKRPAQDSTTIETARSGLVFGNIRSRRYIALQNARALINQRENGLDQPASRIRDANITSSAVSNNSSNSSAENIGLANILHESNEDSDDSIRPANRRHFSRYHSNRFAGRYHSRSGYAFASNNQIFRTSYSHDIHANILEAEQNRPDPRSRRFNNYRIMQSYGPSHSGNSVPLSSRNTVPPSFNSGYMRHSSQRRYS